MRKGFDKAAGLAGKVAKKGLDKAGEARATRKQTSEERKATAAEASGLSPHHFTHQVVGESHYQKALVKAVGRQKDRDGSYWKGSAEVRHDQKNKHDPWAMEVRIGGRRVGYLPSADSNQALAQELGGGTLVVPARIKGGFKRVGSRAYYGVELVL